MTKQVEQIPVNEESPAYKRIAWWVENTLIRVIKTVINSVSTQIRQIFSFGISDALEDYEKELIPIMRPFAEQILSVPGLPDYVRQPLENALKGSSPAGAIIISAMVGLLAAVVSQGIIGPVGRNLEHQGERVFRSFLLDPGISMELFNRKITSEDELRKLLEMNGVPNDAINWLLQLRVPLLDDTTLTQLMWREEIGADALNHELSKRGMNQAQIMLWKQIREVIPSPNELISIAVREGFNDEVARAFGYDEDYPTEAAMWAKKQGMTDKFFRASWRAHWRLPGLVQVREMYHRGIVSEDELRIYLKAADLPIFWRGAIVKWMDRVVTRVDARRMFAMGIWSPVRVYDHHRELGYNDKDATDLTDWVIANYMETDRELTKTDILSMYQDGILNSHETTLYLTTLDYRPEAIALLMAHRDLKRDEAYERQVISNVRALFVGGLYDRTDVFAQLGKLATPDTVIKQSLAVWDLEKERKVAVPTTVQLKDMVLKEVITIQEFIAEMRNKKYPDKYINWYVKLWFEE